MKRAYLAFGLAGLAGMVLGVSSREARQNAKLDALAEFHRERSATASENQYVQVQMHELPVGNALSVLHDGNDLDLPQKGKGESRSPLSDDGLGNQILPEVVVADPSDKGEDGKRGLLESLDEKEPASREGLFGDRVPGRGWLREKVRVAEKSEEKIRTQGGFGPDAEAWRRIQMEDSKSFSWETEGESGRGFSWTFRESSEKE